MIYPCHKNIDVTKDWLESLQEFKEGNFDWGFVLKENGKLIGSESIVWNEEDNAWKFGYNIAYDY